ncbi:MAG: hypothetical protein Q8N69_03580 [bacterium]|nr:hypothetical protein [bacterium]
MSKKNIYLMVLAIVVIFLAQDFFYWAVLDNFQTPLRYIKGDTSLYVYQLNSVIDHNKPACNPTFWENKCELGRFFVFGKLLSFVPFHGKIPTAWWIIILRGAVPLLVFFILARLLNLFGANKKISYIFSFIFVLFYGPMTFKGGSALTNWFLPAFLFGLFLVLKFYKSEKVNLKSSLFLLASLPFFSFHPVYFAVGTMVSGFLWLHIFFQDRLKNKKLIVYFLIWLALALALFWRIFLPFMFSGNPEFSVILNDMAARNTLLETRFPFLFLFGARYLLVLLSAIYFVLKIFKNKIQDVELKKKTVFVLALASACFVGLNSYIVLGKYYLNDHFPFVESYLAMLFLILLYFIPRNLWGRKLKYLGISFLFFTILSVLVVLIASNFKPVYSGPWLTIFLIYFIAGMVFYKPVLIDSFPLSHRKFLLVFLVSTGIFYAIFINYWDDRFWFPQHKKAEEYRGLINELNKLPEGVILSDPNIANLTLIYTRHKVYWSPIAMHDAVSTNELFERWIRARAIFPEEEQFNNRSAIYSVYGARDNKCREYKRYIYLNLLAKLGIDSPRKAICDESVYEKWPEVKTVADKFVSEIKSGKKKWDPIYKIDYLIVEKGKDKVSQGLIAKYFKEIDRGSNYIIYRFKQ